MANSGLSLDPQERAKQIIAQARSSKKLPDQNQEGRLMSTARSIVGTPGRRFATETAGMMGGEALGAPVGAAAGALLGPEAIPAGAMAGRAGGGGVGYALTDILNDYADAFANRGKYPSMGSEIRKFPVGVAKGAAMQQAGEHIIGPALGAVGRGVKKVAPAAVRFASDVPEKATEFLLNSGKKAGRFFNKFPGTEEEMEKLSGEAARALEGSEGASKFASDKAKSAAEEAVKKAGQEIGKAKVGLGMRGATPEQEAARIAASPKAKTPDFKSLNSRFTFLNGIQPKEGEDPREFLVNAIRFKGQIQDAIHGGESFNASQRAHLSELVKIVDGWVGKISPEYKALERTFSGAKDVATKLAENAEKPKLLSEKYKTPEVGAEHLRHAAMAKSGEGLAEQRAIGKVAPGTMRNATGNATSEEFNRILPNSRFGKLALMRLPATVAGAYTGMRSSKGHPIAGAMMGAGSMLALQSPRVLAEVVTRFPMLLNNPAVRSALARLGGQGVGALLGDNGSR